VRKTFDPDCTQDRH